MQMHCLSEIGPATRACCNDRHRAGPRVPDPVAGGVPGRHLATGIPKCVFRPIVTGRSGNVTADSGIVTDRSGIVTEGVLEGFEGCV